MSGDTPTTDTLTGDTLSGDTLTVSYPTITVDLGECAMIHRGTPTREDYDEAQAILDRHVTQSSTGRCLECDQYGPCYSRESAIRLMSRYLWLPSRTPGASRPELVGARRVH